MEKRMNPAGTGNVRLSAILSILLLLLILHGCGREEGFERYIDVQYVRVVSPDDILPLVGREVRPLVYTDIIDLGDMSPLARKRKFIQLMLPSILIVNNYMEGMRRRLDRIAEKSRRQIWLRSADREFLESRMEAYRASDINELRYKMEVHPVSIVLAQAALESGWGSSRFFAEGNNAFGIWSFDESHSRLEASGKRGTRSVYLKKYRALPWSVLDYYRTIARGPYRAFRKRRELTDDPYELTPLLYNYSETRGEYVDKVMAVIEHAGLKKYDDYILDPDYLK